MVAHQWGTVLPTRARYQPMSLMHPPGPSTAWSLDAYTQRRVVFVNPEVPYSAERGRDHRAIVPSKRLLKLTLGNRRVCYP